MKCLSFKIWEDRQTEEQDPALGAEAVLDELVELSAESTSPIMGFNALSVSDDEAIAYYELDISTLSDMPGEKPVVGVNLESGEISLYFNGDPWSFEGPDGPGFYRSQSIDQIPPSEMGSEGWQHFIDAVSDEPYGEKW